MQRLDWPAPLHTAGAGRLHVTPLVLLLTTPQCTLLLSSGHIRPCRLGAGGDGAVSGALKQQRRAMQQRRAESLGPVQRLLARFLVCSPASLAWHTSQHQPITALPCPQLLLLTHETMEPNIMDQVTICKTNRKCKCVAFDKTAPRCA